MNNRIVIIIALILAGTLAVGWWVGKDPSADFTESLPGEDNRSTVMATLEKVNIGEFFERLASDEVSMNEVWPGFRGARFDNYYYSDIALIDKFPESGPEILWSVELGEGHAGAAVYKGLAYILDYDESDRADMLRCFKLDSGEEQWRRWYKVNVKRNHGISRTVPAVNEDYIITIGPKCHVMCVERKTGDYLWGIDVAKEYESEVPLWYTGQCPLVIDKVLILATGGKNLLAGVDCKTGEVIWKTENPRGWKMSHASVLPFEFGGRKMYVYPAIGGIVGVAADGEFPGEVLWENTDWDHAVVSPSAVCMPDGKIFLTAGYGAGSMVIQLSEMDGVFSTSTVDEFKPAHGLASEQQTPVYFAGHLFGIQPKDAAALRNQFVCVNPINCKQTVWTSGKTNRFGLGPYILADGKFYLLNDDATLNIIKASSSSFQLMDQYRLFEGHDAWAPIAVADGYMLLRDSKKMICLDMRK